MVTPSPDSGLLLCTATVAASEAIGDINNVNFTDSPELATTTRFSIPFGQKWTIEDLYITVAGDAGTSEPVIKIVKSGGRVMGTTPPLSNLLVSNNSRPPYSNLKFVFFGNETIQAQTINTIANDLTIDAIRFTMRIKIRPMAPGLGIAPGLVR